jgi:GNAT superfamily N-acetyltransferase
VTSSAVIRPLEAREVPEAQRIIRRAFGTFLGAPDPETFWGDLDYAGGRFGAEHVAAFAAEQDGQLAGTNFATRWGSVGFFGPITIRPDIWDGGIGQRLVQAACDTFETWGVSHAGLFTFPQSPKHVWTYGKFGFHPRFLTPVMVIAASPGDATPWLRFGALPEGQRLQVLESVRALTERLYPGLDLSGEIRTVTARKLGDTLLLMDGDSRVAAFAVCHWGAGTEAGTGTLLVKFGAALPGPGSEARFAALLEACIGFAASVGMTTLVAGVNTARDAAYRALQRRGFRTQFQGVTMHRPNEPGYSRPDLFVLDDWR